MAMVNSALYNVRCMVSGESYSKEDNGPFNTDLIENGVQRILDSNGFCK